MVLKTSKEGFTLVELSLAMVFISLLALSIVLITMNAVSAYRKGVTLNRINTVGTEIIDDIRLAIQNSSSNSVKSECSVRFESDENNNRTNCEEDGGQLLTSVVKYANVKVTSDDAAQSMPIYGAFCSGTYSYVWNSGYAFSEDASGEGGTAIEKATVKLDDGTVYSDFRMLKLHDENRKVCSQQISAYPSKNKNIDLASEFRLGLADLGEEEPVGIIEEDSDLALYMLESLAPAESGNGANLFYNISFILGTIRGGPDVRSNNSCKTPSESAVSNFDYCAINKFNFAVQASGE